LAYSRKPEPEVAYDERIALPWIKNLQTNWRKQLLSQPLVETPNSKHELKDISVPCFASFGESNAKTINKNSLTC
jgi:hypothetical protein